MSLGVLRDYHTTYSLFIAFLPPYKERVVIIHTINFFKLMFFHLAIDVTKKGYQKRKLIEFYIVGLRDIWGSWDNTQSRLDDHNTSTFSIPE